MCVAPCSWRTRMWRIGIVEHRVVGRQNRAARDSRTRRSRLRAPAHSQRICAPVSFICHLTLRSRRLQVAESNLLRDLQSAVNPSPLPSTPTTPARAYFASTPVVYRGAGAVHAASRCRDLRVADLDVEPALRDVDRRSMSPSRTAAIGPPRDASGATWPTMKPRVAPENRPSVTSATDSPSPAPTIAPVTAEHLAHARARRSALRSG